MAIKNSKQEKCVMFGLQLLTPETLLSAAEKLALLTKELCCQQRCCNSHALPPSNFLQQT